MPIQFTQHQAVLFLCRLSITAMKQQPAITVVSKYIFCLVIAGHPNIEGSGRLKTQ
jgi:hypothetical protein